MGENENIAIADAFIEKKLLLRSCKGTKKVFKEN